MLTELAFDVCQLSVAWLPAITVAGETEKLPETGVGAAGCVGTEAGFVELPHPTEAKSRSKAENLKVVPRKDVLQMAGFDLFRLHLAASGCQCRDI